MKSTKTLLLVLSLLILTWSSLCERPVRPPKTIPSKSCTEVSNPQYIWSRSDFKQHPLGGSVWGVTAPKGGGESACWADTQEEIVDAIEKSKHPFLIIAAHGVMHKGRHRFDIGGKKIGSAQFTNWDKPILFISCMGDERNLVKDANFEELAEKMKKMKKEGDSQYLGTEGYNLMTRVLNDTGYLLYITNKVWNETS